MNASAIIVAALREGNLIPVDAAPTASEQAELLDLLNNYIASLIGFELGELLFEWPVPPPQRTAPVSANYPLGQGSIDLPSDVWPYPPANVRLAASNDTPTTVYLQQWPDDGARVAVVNVGATAALTLDGNGRLIDGATTYTADPPVVAEWFYRSDLGQWTLVSDLTLTDESPFPRAFNDLLITGLSIRAAARYGNDPRATTLSTNQSMLAKFKARYRQHPPVLGGGADTPRSRQSFNFGEYGNLADPLS